MHDARTEAALQERFQRGDLDAFEQLVSPHLDVLYTVCLRMLGSEAAADDATQDALVNAMRKHGAYTPGRPIRPWLLVIGTNVCRSRLRSVWWKRVLGLVDEPAVATDPEGLTAALERDRQVRRALATLPVDYREALTLFHLQDMSYAEMAEITGVKIPALKQRVRRGRTMLEHALEAMYPELVVDRREGRRNER